MEDDEYTQTMPPRTGVRQRNPFENFSALTADIIEPVTQGFEQINRDMAFNYYDLFERKYIFAVSQLVTICDMYRLPKTKYLILCNLATVEATSRSKEGWIGELFTKLTQISKTEYTESQKEKKGFSFFNLFPNRVKT